MLRRSSHNLEAEFFPPRLIRRVKSIDNLLLIHLLKILKRQANRFEALHDQLTCTGADLIAALVFILGRVCLPHTDDAYNRCVVLHVNSPFQKLRNHNRHNKNGMPLLQKLHAVYLETAVLGTYVVGDFGTGTSADTSVRSNLYKHMY